MKQSSASRSDNNTRRDFLKTTGVALAGGLLVSHVISVAETKSDACDFAALPDDFVYLNSGTEGSMPECVLSHLKKA